MRTIKQGIYLFFGVIFTLWALPAFAQDTMEINTAEGMPLFRLLIF
jgi:hypothetical protein